MVYSKILDDYFQTASYFKPTGDGLIVIIPYTNKNLNERVNSILKTCLNIVNHFASLCADEPMVNFSTPNKIGIGIARGSACCILDTKENKVLDYSGRILNLASRLMDMARPSGIVFDVSVGFNLLEDDIKEKFSKEMVYVRGVAETNPRKIYYSKEYTLIPSRFKEPILEPKWESEKRVTSIKELKTAKIGWYSIKLEKKPLDVKEISLRMEYKGQTKSVPWVWVDFKIDDVFMKLESRAGKYEVNISTSLLFALLESRQVTEGTKLHFEVTYSVKK